MQTAQLRHALAQQSTLLHEVDHRVKNNLQLIASLLMLQTRRASEPAVKQALGSALERINAVATVHRRLFQSDDVALFDVAAFVRDLADDALGAAGRSDIGIDLDARPAQVINELLLNAIHHAFPDGRTGRITLAVGPTQRGLRIEVADNGVGMQRAPSEAPVTPGLGLTIVGLLSQQLHAEVEREEAGPGVRTVLHLPLEGVS